MPEVGRPVRGRRVTFGLYGSQRWLAMCNWGDGGMLGNPFTYGNPISDPQRFIGRGKREVEQIFGRLRNAEFESSSLVRDHKDRKDLSAQVPRESRSAGGSRVQVRTAQLRLRRPGRRTQAMDPDRLWRRLLMLMRQQCADQGVKESVAAVLRRGELDPFELDELFQKVDDSGQHVVFLLDEFERVTANPNFGPDFFRHA